MVFASPLFLILIGIEFFYSLYKKTSLYKLNDSVNNFSTGILEEIGTLPLRGLLVYTYYYLYEHFAYFHISPSIPAWIALWLGVDCCYYWYHRASHRINFLWIGHSVHHQSDQYNLSVALRQGFFQTMTSWVFYLPLAFIGFPTWMFVTMATLNTIYQFWIHTQNIKTMGWFETLFNTPSHHRVHHGTNPQYIDKNYAGSLIVWDKLFGTFEPENEPVVYGVTEPLDSWNPFYANVKVIKDVFHYGKGFKNKFNILIAFFRPPEWILNKLKTEENTITKRNTVQKNTTSPKAYMITNIGFAVFLYTYLSLTFNPHTLLSWLIGALILITLYTLGRVANGTNKIQVLEITRALLAISSLIMITNKLPLAFSLGLAFFLVNFILYNSIPTRTLSYLARY